MRNINIFSESRKTNCWSDNRPNWLMLHKIQCINWPRHLHVGVYSRRWRWPAVTETQTRVTWLVHVRRVTAFMTFHAPVNIDDHISRRRCFQLVQLMLLTACSRWGPPKSVARRRWSCPVRWRPGVRRRSSLIVWEMQLPASCRNCLAATPIVAWRQPRRRQSPASTGVVDPTRSPASIWCCLGQLSLLPRPASVCRRWRPATLRQRTTRCHCCPTASWTGRRGSEWRGRLYRLMKREPAAKWPWLRTALDPRHPSTIYLWTCRL